MFHLGRRFFSQAAFAPDPQEIVFSDSSHIYLASIAGRKVGLVTAGTRFLLLSPPFSKAEQFTR